MKFQIIPHILHFCEPAGTSRGTYRTRKVWYIVLENEGRKGIGECAPLPVLSRDDLPDYEEVLHKVCTQACLNHSPGTYAFPYPSIQFGLECAFRMLNGNGRCVFDSDFTLSHSGIPINGLIWMGTYEEMQKRAEEKLESGFRCIKVKIGAINFDEELCLLRYIRNHPRGADIELRVDANGAFSPQEAPKRLKQLSELNIHSIEQPIRAGQWDAMAHLCDTSPIPVALDEEIVCLTEDWSPEHVLDAIHPQYIVLKPSLVGGFAACQQWIDAANGRNIQWWVTSALESNVGLSAIAQWTATLNPTMAQGLGTGLLYTDNTPSETSIRGDELWYTNSQQLPNPLPQQ